MIYGAKDTIQTRKEVKQYYQSIASKEKFSIIMSNGFHQLYKDEEAEEELYPKILEWIDLLSTKKSVRWANTPPFNLHVIRKIHPLLKWVVLVVVPLLTYLCRRLISHKLLH